METQLLIPEVCKDDFQWARELGYMNGLPAQAPPEAPCAEQSHQLMIFTGLNAGANLPLADGRHSMGRSFECDLVLKDPGIGPIHLTLICTASTISIRPEGGVVYLDGHRINGETVLPEPPPVVTIAGIHFGLATEGACWTPLDLPSIREEKEKSSRGDRDTQTGDETGRTPRSDTSNTSHVPDTATVRPRKASFSSKFVTMTFLLLFALSALFLFRVKAPDPAALVAQVETQFKECYLPPPAIQVDAEGFLEVTGYVTTDFKKDEMATFLKTLPVAVRSHLYVDDQVARELQDYVAKMAFLVDAVYRGSGHVMAKGFTENDEDAAVIKSLLKSNVMGLRTVDLHLLQLDKVRADAAAVLKDAGLTEKIDLRPQSGHLLAKGALDPDQHVSWQTAKKEIRERLGGQIAIVDETENQEQIGVLPGKIDIPIAGVTMQPFPFITLQDGKVYFKGASLQNGTVIKKIGPERIVVEIDGQDYYYNF